MSLPLATTRVTVTRTPPDPNRDGYDPPPDPVTISEHLPAVITSPSGRATYTAGDRQVITASFRTEPADIQPGDSMLDETTGLAYRVVWVTHRAGMGLDHMLGDLTAVTGAST